MKMRLEEELRQLESQQEVNTAPVEQQPPAYKPFKLSGQGQDPMPQQQYGFNPGATSTPGQRPQHHVLPEPSS